MLLLIHHCIFSWRHSDELIDNRVITTIMILGRPAQVYGRPDLDHEAFSSSLVLFSILNPVNNSGNLKK